MAPLSQGDVIVRDSIGGTATIQIGLGRGQVLIVNVGDDPDDKRRINIRHVRPGAEQQVSIGHCTLDLRTGEVTR